MIIIVNRICILSLLSKGAFNISFVAFNISLEYDTILFWLRYKVTEYADNTLFRLQYNITEYDITAYRVR